MQDRRDDQKDEPTVYRCKNCGCRDLRVIKTVKLEEKIRRRRRCRNCSRLMWTTEVVENED